MVGWPSARPKRRRKRSAHDQALDAYEDAAKSLMRLVELSAAAVAACSGGLTGPAIGGGSGRGAAAELMAGSAERKADAEDLLRSCCLDGAGRIDVVPGVWRDDIAAGAEGMASLANRAAAAWAANGALSSASTARVVLAELSASEGWLEFAARVAAAERAAAGTVLGTRPVEEQAAAAARLVERSVPALSLEAGHVGGGAAAAGATGTGANGGRAVVPGRAAAVRREAANVWAAASAAWLEARDLAAGEGDAAVVNLALGHARMADENASRLRAA